MKTVRAKIATAATILGLAGLGGFALASNPGPNPATGAPGAVSAQTAAAGSAVAAGSTPAGGTQPVVTGASGSSATTVPVAARSAPAAQTKPVVTHTSGAGGGQRHEAGRDDDGEGQEA